MSKMSRNALHFEVFNFLQSSIIKYNMPPKAKYKTSKSLGGENQHNGNGNQLGWKYECKQDPLIYT